MKPYSRAIANFRNFHGRTARTEFWLFQIMLYAFSFLVYLLDRGLGTADAHGGGLLTALFAYFNFVPQVAISVRRMHDSDHSSLWLLLPPIAFVFALFDSTPAPNRFGPVPITPTPRPRRAARASSIAPASTPQQARDVVAEIERLAHLKAGGHLTESEFAAMKAKALGHAAHP